MLFDYSSTRPCITRGASHISAYSARLYAFGEHWRPSKCRIKMLSLVDVFMHIIQLQKAPKRLINIAEFFSGKSNACSKMCVTCSI